MDTKSKKSFRLKNLIIALCVVLPAVLLVSLYPKMEEAMVEKKTEYQEMQENVVQQLDRDYAYELDSQAINYAMEASYHIYGQLLGNATQKEIDFSVLYEYGWVMDYTLFCDNASFVATYEGEDGKRYEMKNTDSFPEDGECITLRFDKYGNLTEASMELPNVYWDNIDTIHYVAMNSKAQYRNNVEYYNEEYETNIKAIQFEPKNFTIEFVLNENSEFLYEYDAHEHVDYYVSPESLYFEIGAYWIALFMALMVALVALILPALRFLETGKEKIFLMPIEIVIALGIGVTGLGVGMCFVMGYSTMHELKESFVELPQILGYDIQMKTLYYGILALNIIGWGVAFFLEYIVISCLRNFIMHPIQYIRRHSLLAGLIRITKKGCKKLYRYATNIDINEKLNRSILKIVLVNFAVLLLLCCLWFFGILGLLLYSVALYIVLSRYGEKLQKQYHSILHATEQMAEGDLKITMEEDLGVFQPIGDSLERVQQGFEKAVVEEAKSQQMKSELITNVSHDLKTPLTAIITYVDLLKNETITEEERKAYIATLDQKSQRLKTLIEDLFEVSKAQSGNVNMNFMDVDVVSLLKQVRSEMSDSIAASNLQFRWKLPENKVNLCLDGQRIYRVFENLLQNILKYAMPHSRAYVDVIEQEQQVQILFRNVSASELEGEEEHLTERFVRGDASRNTEGSGLGLAIAKSFVELQNGTFHIEIDGDLFKVCITFDR